MGKRFEAATDNTAVVKVNPLTGETNNQLTIEQQENKPVPLNTIEKIAYAVPATLITLPFGAVKGIYEGAKSMIMNPMTTAVETAGAMVGGKVVDDISRSVNGKNFAHAISDVSGIEPEVTQFFNPGYLYGGAKAKLIKDKKLIPKFFKGDKDIAWSKLDGNHWIFNKEARNATNVTMAATNRVTPFLFNYEKTPLRLLAYPIAKRTRGNASVGVKDIVKNPATYTGAATPQGSTDMNLLGMYLFKDDPLISRTPWFKQLSSKFKPRHSYVDFGARYKKLYPNTKGYQMQSVVPEGKPVVFNSVDELQHYAPIGQKVGKEAGIVMDLGEGQFIPVKGTNMVYPINDVAGHQIMLRYNKKGQLIQDTADLWKFNPNDYSLRWTGDAMSNYIRAQKQAGLMDKIGTPFVLSQSNPIKIGNKRIWEDFKNIPNWIRKQPKQKAGLIIAQHGAVLNPVQYIESNVPEVTPDLDLGLDFEVDNIENVFSPYSTPEVKPSKPKAEEWNWVYYKPAQKTVVTPKQKQEPQNKNVQSNKSFDDYFDSVVKKDSSAKDYRTYLTKIASIESSFNPKAKNKKIPAYGLFQMLEGYEGINNISNYGGTDIDTFLNNPDKQIQAAIKLTKANEKVLKNYFAKAKAMGISKDELLALAHFSGAGGAIAYLNGANRNDGTSSQSQYLHKYRTT